MDRGGVYHSLSSSCRELEIRFAAGRRCKGEAREVDFTSLTTLEAPWPQQRGPDTWFRARDSVAYSRSVCGPRSEATKSLAARYATSCTRANFVYNRVLPIAKIRAFVFYRKSIPRRSGWIRIRCSDAACMDDVCAVVSFIDITQGRERERERGRYILLKLLFHQINSIYY